ncbi:hypothetical protein T4B_1050 [Trichinella pseudospiralis]|uniref:Apple domain-containing protein n=1 Tax=Trichinella pseudospiralis TaxID=6337 RepID=A0A0V1JE20_TRIPS|nr:hypothetical protein T4B_1050 [Trichinella pseudospiralis]
MEVCKVNVIHNGIIENVTSIQIIANVRSVNRCLHFCRPILHQLFYCAIIYSRHNYKCELLKRNTERSSAYFVDGENNLMELLNCYPDRKSLRINNPPPLQYYLKETGEICVLEFYNATQLRGFYPIETLENVENLKSCIYACRLRYYSCICLAINYTMKKQCILLRKEPNYGIYNVEHWSIFGEMLFCEPGTLRDDFNFKSFSYITTKEINRSFRNKKKCSHYTQCKSIMFAAYLNSVQMTCILDKQNMKSSTLQPVKMQTVLGKSFEECIIMCYLLHPEKKCSAVKYFQILMKCYLLATHRNTTTPETSQAPFNVIYVNGCRKGSLYLHEIENYSMLVFGGTFISLQIGTLNRTFIIERRPTVDSIRSKIIFNHQKDSISDCFFSCYVITWKTGCNAIIYNPRTSLCTLLKHEASSLPITFAHHEDRLMFLLHLSLPWDVEVNSVLIPATHNVLFELCSENRARATSASKALQPNDTLEAVLKSAENKSRIAIGYVHLYRHMEVCKINIIHSRKVENVINFRTIWNIRSINKCMHFCQPLVRQSIYCAIEYSKENYKCVLLRSSSRRNVRFVGIDKHLIEVLECHPDRPGERKNNFAPLQFYFAETSEICVVEFYKSSLLSSFVPMETFENVEHVKSCIQTCRLRHRSFMCTAINYTMDKECNLFRKEWNATLYAVKPRSLFAEILVCEPGTLVDETFDF